jgi:hypothetical protein
MTSDCLHHQVRAWTRGWDLFAPDEHLVFHKWERGHRKGTFWEVPGGAELKRRAQARVRRLLTGRPLCAPPEEAADDRCNHAQSDAPEEAADDRCNHAQSDAPEEAEDSHQDSLVVAPRVTDAAQHDDDGGGDSAAAAVAAAAAKRIEESLASAPEPSALVWGVGHVRSLQWYEAFSGVDFAKMRVSPQAERGGMPDEACFWDRFACIDAWLEARRDAEPEPRAGPGGETREGDCESESEREERERPPRLRPL